MKILFVTATYIPTVNGVSYHIKHLKKQLEILGHKVYVLAPKFPGYKDNEDNIFRYFSMPNPFITNYPIGIPLHPFVDIKKISPDIIHTHHPQIVGAYASNISEKLNVPLFFTAHTQYHQYLNYYFPQGYQITSKIITNDLQRLSIKCRQVICPSDQTEKRLNNLGIKNTILLKNGIDTKKFHIAKRQRHAKLTVIYTGRINREKNPVFLINLAREMKKRIVDFSLLIVGDGLLLNKISSLIHKYKLGDNVVLSGNVDQDLLPNILNSADIFFTPSTSEVMPLSVLEAESCGLPIVALEKSGLESIVHHQKSGLILKSNPKIVADEIVSLWNDRKKLNSYSKESRNIAEANSIENYSKKLIAIYQKYSQPKSV